MNPPQWSPSLYPDVPLHHEFEADDALWMQRALELAHAAAAGDEVPVGCVIVHAGVLVSEGYNLTRTLDDPTAHAEMVALRRAARKLGTARLLDTTMYVTLEPCAMCAGAIVLAKVNRLVFGASDPKTGMAGSLACVVQDSRLNHHVELTSGVLEEASADLLRGFFRARRRRAEVEGGIPLNGPGRKSGGTQST
ncbi:MAG TPA: tRNA adenosine(34) deaminase TadA [Longimicrobiales bacterium]|nr:tRNA adenosine(34) deaminase TadA [Longimicrobiales bacterium]